MSVQQSRGFFGRPCLLRARQNGFGCGRSEIRIQDVSGEDGEDLDVVFWDTTEAEEGSFLRCPRKRKGFLSRIEIGGFKFGRIDPGDGSEGVGVERERSQATGSDLRSEGGLPDGGVF